MNNQFEKITNRTTNGKRPGKILCIDPGGTTGIAFFENNKLDSVAQIPGYIHGTTTIDWESIEQLLESYQPNVIVCEEYLVYAHKLEEHTFSKIPTLRIIGFIQYWAWKHNVPLYFQTAQMAKGFCTDAKLKQWGFWQKGMRHSRDAIRHGCYFLCFSKFFQK